MNLFTQAALFVFALYFDQMSRHYIDFRNSIAAALLNQNFEMFSHNSGVLTNPQTEEKSSLGADKNVVYNQIFIMANIRSLYLVKMKSEFVVMDLKVCQLHDWKMLFSWTSQESLQKNTVGEKQETFFNCRWGFPFN